LSYLTTPGSWLFSRHYLAWLQDPDLSVQLPASYRVFAWYCRRGLFCPPFAEACLRSLIAVRRGLRQDGIVPLQFGPSPIFLDLHDPRFLRVPTEIEEAAECLAPLLRLGDTFIDAGANHGAFSLAAARLVGPRGFIMAIEPQPRLAKAVESTLRQAGVDFEVHATALGNHQGTATLFRQWAGSGSAGLIRGFSSNSRGKFFTVPVAPIDQLIDGRPLPGRIVWKLDIEGSELACLEGAARLLRERRPSILMEVNPKAMEQAGTSLRAIVEALDPRRYSFSDLSTADRSPQNLEHLTTNEYREILLTPATFHSGV
jgi:FkbM family methyltransferase